MIIPSEEEPPFQQLHYTGSTVQMAATIPAEIPALMIHVASVLLLEA